MAVKVLALALALIASRVPAHAQPQAQPEAVNSPAELTESADHLRAGQWLLAPDIAPIGPVLIYVDLSRQVATVYRNGVRIGVSTISSGRRGHETPAGTYTILEKQVRHRSTLYNDAPMPYMQRLTMDGIALHGGGLPGRPVSHGCVRLPLAFARALYAITDRGGAVVIAGEAGATPEGQAAGVLAPVDESGAPLAHEPLSPDQPYRWTPEAAPYGPITMIFSRADQRVIVLRNGAEIGRARAEIPDSDFATHVLIMKLDPVGGAQWTYVDAPGRQTAPPAPVDPSLLSRVHLPREFYERVQAVLQPGATILLTPHEIIPRPVAESAPVPVFDLQ